MPAALRAQSGDPRLQPFLEATSEEAATAALDALLSGDVARTLREAVARGLREAGGAAGHHEDIAADVRVKLVRKCWSLWRGEGEPVENMLAYVASAAENGCYGFLRQRFPERTRFRNRVRYAVAHHPGTRLSLNSIGVWMCARHEADTPRPGGRAADAFLDDPRGWLHLRRIDVAQPLPGLVQAVLDAVGEAVPLDRLVEALAVVLGVAEAQASVSRDRHRPSAVEEVMDPAPAIGEVLEQRQALGQVWGEIAQLPVRQRVALLLNLRDADGASMLQMLPATGVVTAAGVAEVLGLAVRELETLWARLPLDDLTIAARLGVTRQQVINLRKSARARLARRINGGAT